MNQIHLLYLCDAWKSRASMRLIMATTVPETMDGAICDAIQDGSIGYGGLTGTAALIAYEAEHDPRHLDYAYLETVGDGERL